MPTNDELFIADIENCTLSGSFSHRDHLRLAWLYLHKYGLKKGTDRMAETIRHFSQYHKAPQKYHETITYAWIRLVYRALLESPQGSNFDDLVSRHPWLLNYDSLLTYYSVDLLETDEARKKMIPPNLRPLP